MTQGIRIVVADDHAVVREGLRSVFAKHSTTSVVGEAGDGEEALDLVERLAPDVLIIGISMPLVDEIEVTRHLRKHRVGTRILVVSSHDMDDHIIALMEAGADGYMTKTATSSQLIDAVERVHKGERVLDSVVEQRMAARLWTRGRIAEDEPKETLTRRERGVLQLAARGLTNKAIATELGINYRTVQAHFNNIYSKLNVSSRMQAVLRALSLNPAEVAKNGQTFPGCADPASPEAALTNRPAIGSKKA